MKKIEDIRIYKRINISTPNMLAGWPGMGNVALGMVDYLRQILHAIPFAEIDTTGFLIPEAIIVEDGIAKFPKLGKNVFSYHKGLNLVIFESDTQLRDKEGRELMIKILDFAKQLNVQRIYTGAAFPLPISHKDESVIFGVGNGPAIRDYISHQGIKIMETGQISGLNGLLLGYAAERDIEAACLLATIPQYAINFPNPKASKAIIETIGKILNFSVDMKGIDVAIKAMDVKMSMIEKAIKEILPIKETEPEIKKPDLGKEEVPDYIMKKVEKLFEEAKQDKQKAYKLKEELDRWNLYNLYEDRFLDLFRKENQ